MAGDADGIRAERGGAKRHLAEALHRVGMEQRVGTAQVRQLCHALDGHDRAGLVIDHHDADKAGVLRERVAQRLDADPAEGVRLEVGHAVALLFEQLDGMEHGVVLHLRGDDMTLSGAAHGGKDRPVVALGAAGGENDPFGGRAERLRHLLTAGTQQARSLHTLVVQSAGVGPVDGQRIDGRLHGGGAGSRRCGVIQIDHRVSSGIRVI